MVLCHYSGLKFSRIRVVPIGVFIADLNCSCRRALELVVERTHHIECIELVERIEFATFLVSEKPVI